MLHHCGDATDMVPQSTPKKLFSPLCIFLLTLCATHSTIPP